MVHILDAHEKIIIYNPLSGYLIEMDFNGSLKHDFC